MPRLERHDGDSHRFWEITLEADAFTMRFGDLGRRPHVRRKMFATPAQARTRYREAIQLMEAQGYDRVVPSVPAPEPALEQLIEALVSRPEELDAYLVYGDHLQARGDPRGELLALQFGLLLKTKGQAAVRERIRKLLERQRAALLGELAKLPGIKVTWRLGFLRSVHLSPGADCSCWDVIPSLLALPSARLLDELSFGEIGDSGALAELLPLGGVQPTLRSLRLRGGHLGSISGLYAVFPALETLEIEAASALLGPIRLPWLGRVVLEGQVGAQPANLRAIATASWPQLRTCRIDVRGYPSDEAELNALYPLLGTAGTPELTVLGILNSRNVGRLLRALVRAPYFRQLTSLDLRGGRLTEAGVRFLLDRPDRFGHLDRLDLSLQAVPYRARQLLDSLPAVQLAR